LTFRVRVTYIGARFGSATTTSWPNPSGDRATHSVSVDASSRIRRPRPAAQYLGEPPGLGADPAFAQLATLAEDADPAFLLVQVDANIVHGWPLLVRP
jgi:hypothetical protein